MQKNKILHTLLICVTILIVTVAFLISNRYEVVSLNSSNSTAYKIDNWTGEVTLLMPFEERKLEKIK